MASLARRPGWVIIGNLTNLSFMVGGACFAWLADQMPVRWIYFLGGCLYLGAALDALSSRAIRESRITATAGQQQF